MTFAVRLKFILNDRGITQKAFATRCGMSPNTIQRYIDGSRKPTEDSILVMAHCLCMSEEQFLEGVDNIGKK